jgi:hypothetical protein
MPITIRKQDVRASNLIFASILLAAITVLLYPSLLNPHALVSATIVSGVIRAGLAFKIRAGYSWVRILFLLYTIPYIGLYLMNIGAFDEPMGRMIIQLLDMILHAWAAVIIVKTQLSDYD